MKPKPACWRWKVVPVDALRVRHMAHIRRKYPTSSPGVLADIELAWDGEGALAEWQRGRCAACGMKSVTPDLVLDHDHQTDLIRGLLCRSCNVLEGRGVTDYCAELFRRYRERPPAVMLGIAERYSDLRPEAFHTRPVPVRTAEDRWTNNAATGLLDKPLKKKAAE